MKSALLFAALFFCLSSLQAQFEYEASAEHPFGLPNPEAPEQILDYAPLIGECDCSSVRRKPDQSWDVPKNMLWRFKYILNGMAVQDDALHEGGTHGGSIRQFIADSTRWYVHYYSTNFPSTTLPAWEGNKNDSTMVLYKEQKAPNGMDGFYRITFSEMTNDGFKWSGDWVNPDESIVYPTWKIDCIKRKEE
ncbi:MAG: hypothetical protein OER83_06880 [Flavobacteriaceae bacterium]|nr:hypothetical protein [Flavobacteriaceae bacterium]MDH3796578.1 hypothetical protein [Flavobacteriaceae bacterium]